jgi:quercetin dioxygenase-like cupin family protein
MGDRLNIGNKLLHIRRIQVTYVAVRLRDAEMADSLTTMRIPMPTLRKLGIIAILCTWLNAFADTPASVPATAPVRTILERHDQTGVSGKEILLGTALLPAGTAIGFHTHPGDEFGYVLKGPLVLKTKGQPDRILNTGDTFFNARGLVHSLATVPGSEGGMALSTWIIDKGEPLASPVTN